MGNIDPLQKINGDFKGKDILSLTQFSPKDIEKLFNVTWKMKHLASDNRPSLILQGKIASLLFYEPSSRTFGSFSSAMMRLGGSTIAIQNPQAVSSVAKGETLEDTIKTFENYCDVIIIRSSNVGDSTKAAKAAFFVPIINAGDGTGEHPTQALLDLFTIYEKFGSLNNLTGLLAGDMLNGRTVHSLIKGLSLYKNNTLYLLSPMNLKLKKDDLENFRKSGIKIIEITSEKEIPKTCHFWYWTRVQKERFTSLSEYEKVKHSFVLTPKLLEQFGNQKMVVMHPLPRVGEIKEAVDSDPRALYLTSQMKNGVFVRMALLALVLGKI